MTDKHIFQHIWDRVERGIQEMAQHYGPRLYRTAVNILSIHEDAEETVNDTYLAIWNAIPPKTPDPFSGYVYKTGRNLALKKLRHNSAQKRGCWYDLSLKELEGCLSGVSLEDEMDARLLGQAIDRFLDTVSPKSRIFFLRRYWFGDSVMEIAQEWAMTQNAVSVNLSRTREKLRAFLIEEGFSL